MPITGRGGRLGSFAKVWGVEEVCANFAKYGALTHYYVRGTWGDVGKMVAAEARRLVSPQGEMAAYITGRLCRSIKGGAEWRGRTKFAAERYTVYVGCVNCPYAIYVHEGYGPHAGNARPFLIVAMKNKKGAAVRKLVASQRALEKKYKRVTKVPIGPGS